MTLVVIGATGDSLPQGTCIISNSQVPIFITPVQTAPWVTQPQAGPMASNTVWVFLNCDGAVRSPTVQPHASVAGLACIKCPSWYGNRW